jgi:glyoxylase-like metal-dependent hydrolase (beta-lactamase superfamily II)
VTEIASGIHRLGNPLVNMYLVQDGDSLTLVDAGLPGFRGQLDETVRVLGSKIEAVILTHGHGDHIGVAEGVRTDAGAAVHIHAADSELARSGKYHKRERSLLPYLRHRATLRLFYTAARTGGLRTPKVAELTTFAEDGELDVPGRPRAIHTPGHSPGHVVFHFPDRGVVIAGDAVVTYNPLTGRRGPQIMPGAFNLSNEQALNSLSRIEPLDGTLLVGHGEPWTGGAAAAVAQAREAGPS